jgi:hypothetical protein
MVATGHAWLVTITDADRVYRKGTDATGAKWQCSGGSKGKFWTRNDDQVIRCDCGSETFSLQYGGYEISATCAKCGHEEVVYDG